jgi:hypothetical protein
MSNHLEDLSVFGSIILKWFFRSRILGDELALAGSGQVPS